MHAVQKRDMRLVTKPLLLVYSGNGHHEDLQEKADQKGTCCLDYVHHNCGRLQRSIIDSCYAEKEPICDRDRANDGIGEPAIRKRKVQ